MEKISNWRYRSVLWRISKVLLIVMPILGLGLLNILLIVNEKVHSAGFNLLKTVLAPVIADETMTGLLSQSPSQKYSSLEMSYKAIEAQQIELKRVSAVRSKVVKNISTKIERRAVANASKNVSSFAAEALLGFGVAAVIALTASDIYDDCQILKDLNELNVSFEYEKEDETTVCGLKFP